MDGPTAVGVGPFRFGMKWQGDSGARLGDGGDQYSPRGQAMFRILIVASCLFLATQAADAATCGSTANRAGCVGPNGAASYNKNTGAVHTAQPYHTNQVAPGTNVQGVRGNSATKAVQPGCAFVNGRRVCS
jgi:hypothetical protein